MVETLTMRTRGCSPALLALVLLPVCVFAHRLDEYLQATLVIIEPTALKLQINLTPGVAVAKQALANIDVDRDGVISTKEAAAYAKLVKQDLTVRADGRQIKLEVTASEFPPLAELHSGAGIIQIEFSAPKLLFAPGRHTISVENRHLPKLSVYMVNAAQPKSRAVRITGQKRAESQAQAEIDFIVVKGA